MSRPMWRPQLRRSCNQNKADLHRLEITNLNNISYRTRFLLGRSRFPSHYRRKASVLLPHRSIDEGSGKTEKEQTKSSLFWSYWVWKGWMFIEEKRMNKDFSLAEDLIHLWWGQSWWSLPISLAKILNFRKKNPLVVLQKLRYFIGKVEVRRIWQAKARCR